MGWFQSTLDTVKEAAGAAPIECPRGWGKVSFALDLDFWFFTPFFDLSRSCPIGGVSNCIQCRYPSRPEDTDRLRENLNKLEAFRQEKVLSESEYATRRQMIINLQDGTGPVPRRRGPPGEGLRTAAWVLGPPGLVIAGAGVWLAMTFPNPELWALPVCGAVATALAVSFAVLGWTKKKETADRSPTARKEFEPRRSR
ncbi:MAG: hypothetical protein ACYSWU_07745 [Planctomycetota bacterium]|jgi:hypothetical protein